MNDQSKLEESRAPNICDHLKEMSRILMSKRKGVKEEAATLDFCKKVVPFFNGVLFQIVVILLRVFLWHNFPRRFEFFFTSLTCRAIWGPYPITVAFHLDFFLSFTVFNSTKTYSFHGLHLSGFNSSDTTFCFNRLYHYDA